MPSAGSQAALQTPAQVWARPRAGPGGLSIAAFSLPARPSFHPRTSQGEDRHSGLGGVRGAPDTSPGPAPSCTLGPPGPPPSTPPGLALPGLQSEARAASGRPGGRVGSPGPGLCWELRLPRPSPPESLVWRQSSRGQGTLSVSPPGPGQGSRVPGLWEGGVVDTWATEGDLAVDAGLKPRQ